ncbi:hypothetical protein N9I33_02050 [Paracoccaceae bacterium]|nr:hypothetical protein [Paracoccaceae bacterium]
MSFVFIYIVLTYPFCTVFSAAATALRQQNLHGAAGFTDPWDQAEPNPL